MGDVPAAKRLPLLALGLVTLVAAVLAGLARIGWGVPAPRAAVSIHGALMVSGFFGTVISLERAVAVGRLWAYAAPLAAGLGAVSLVAGAPPLVGESLLTAGGAVMVAASVVAFVRMRALFTLTLVAGAASWLGGNATWLAGRGPQSVVPWWLGFLVLTIAGERLELSRLRQPSRLAAPAFAAVLALLVAAVPLASLGVAAGPRLLALGFVALAAWLARFDIAWRTVRSRALTRFIAVALLSGYAWLTAGGAVLFASGALSPGGLAYDAALHAVLLGFVFSMVMGHAPVIIPAVARVSLRYHPVAYAPLALLHLSLAVRLAGDAAGDYAVRRVGGALNAAALAAFVLVTIASVARGRARPKAA